MVDLSLVSCLSTLSCQVGSWSPPPSLPALHHMRTLPSSSCTRAWRGCTTSSTSTRRASRSCWSSPFGKAHQRSRFWMERRVFPPLVSRFPGPMASDCMREKLLLLPCWVPFISPAYKGVGYSSWVRNSEIFLKYTILLHAAVAYMRGLFCLFHLSQLI